MRALRPLKLVSKNEGMKLVVNSILASIPNLINVFLISMLFYFVFGVMGLQMLSGRVSYCSTDETLDKEPCLTSGGEWLIPPNNYNNVMTDVFSPWSAKDVSHSQCYYLVITCLAHMLAPLKY